MMELALRITMASEKATVRHRGLRAFDYNLLSGFARPQPRTSVDYAIALDNSCRRFGRLALLGSHRICPFETRS